MKQFIPKLKLFFVLYLFIVGCTPKFNWRVVVNNEFQFTATYPDRPVKVTRTVNLNESDYSLTLQAAKVDELMFAVGVIALNQENTVSQQQVKQALYLNMLSNLTVSNPNVQQKIFLGHQATYIEANGRLPNGEPGRLLGYFFVQNNKLYEIIMLGPVELFNNEVKTQWFNGFYLTTKL